MDPSLFQDVHKGAAQHHFAVARQSSATGPRAKAPKRKRPMFGKCPGIFILATFAMTPAVAQQSGIQDPVYSFSAKLDQVDKLVEGPTGVLAAEHVTRMSLEAKARFKWRFDGQKQLFVEPFLRQSTFDPVEDELAFGVFAEYRHPLGGNDKIQLRWRAGLEVTHDVFKRVTAQVVLDKSNISSRTSRVTARYRYRDQNDEKTFVGYDQHEAFVSFEQVWKPAKGSISRVSGMVYGDFRQADAAEYDYAEFGARVNVRLDPHQDWDVMAVAKAFVREYDGNFSSDYDFSRRDKKLAVALEAKYHIDKKQSLAGAFGWEINQSNVDIRAYSGPVFRLQYEMKFN
jgi:hypothetical protein